jgi:hypothetical protein
MLRSEQQTRSFPEGQRAGPECRAQRELLLKESVKFWSGAYGIEYDQFVSDHSHWQAQVGPGTRWRIGVLQRETGKG